MIMIIIFGLGAVGGLFFSNKLGVINKNTDNKYISPADDNRDTRDCVISAGYFWCESKQKCLRTQEEECVAQPALDNSTNIIEDSFASINGKICQSDRECASFPCFNGKCLVKKCASNNQCPNGLCGLHLTPRPGYCTNQDVW